MEPLAEALDRARPPRLALSTRVEWENIGSPDDPLPTVIAEGIPGIRLEFHRESQGHYWSTGMPEWTASVEVTEGAGRECKQGHNHTPDLKTAPFTLVDCSTEPAAEVYEGPLVDWLEQLAKTVPCAFGPAGKHHGGELVRCASCNLPTCDHCGVNEGDTADGDWLCRGCAPDLQPPRTLALEDACVEVVREWYRAKWFDDLPEEIRDWYHHRNRGDPAAVLAKLLYQLAGLTKRDLATVGITNTPAYNAGRPLDAELIAAVEAKVGYALG